MTFALQGIGWFVILTVIMSFVEHFSHRIVMHKKTFLSKHFKIFKKSLDHHVARHHVQYYKSFTDEPVPPGEDRHIRLSIREGFLEALPICAIIATMSIQAAVTFEIVVCLHHYLWNKIHIEMHKPEKRFFSGWPLYKFHARHHFLHHRHPDKNFNVVFLLADYVFGVTTKPDRSDLKAMHELGLLDLSPAELLALADVDGEMRREADVKQEAVLSR